jgi:hypothetical protein
MRLDVSDFFVKKVTMSAVSIKFEGSDLINNVNSYSILNICKSEASPELYCQFKSLEPVLLDKYKGYYFWKYLIHVPILETTRAVQYGFSPQMENEFFVPGLNQPYNLAFSSCNGLSSDVDMTKYSNGIMPLWNDVLRKHREITFHGMIGGGDQIYCDKVFQLSSLLKWLSIPGKKAKSDAPFTAEMDNEVEEFYFENYMNHFSTPGFKEALACLPFNFVWDDHDIFDGYGSYPEYLQNSPVFFGVFDSALRFYLLFQHHTNQTLFKNEKIGNNSHHSLLQYGPHLAVLSIDVRSERTLETIIPSQTWELIWNALDGLSSNVNHLIVNATIPLAYPRVGGEEAFKFAAGAVKSTENILDKFQKFVVNGSSDNLEKETWASAFAKTGAFKKVVNAFGEPELLDDLNDHWTAMLHEQERGQFISRLQNFSKKKGIRVTFLSGDVHVGGAARFASEKGLLYPDQDYRLMYQVVSSAIGNAPPPAAIIQHLHLSSKKIFFDKETVEKMHHIFKTDLADNPLANQYLMAARNWCCITSPNCYDLVFDLRMERVVNDMKGETKSYLIYVPPLNYHDE